MIVGVALFIAVACMLSRDVWERQKSLREQRMHSLRRWTSNLRKENEKHGTLEAVHADGTATRDAL